jgi:hypothetical protein
LGVLKNMLFTFYLSPTLGEDTKRILGFSKISAPSLLLLHYFSKVYYNPGIGHEAMQNKLSKEDKSPTIKKEERNEEKKKDYRLIAHGPYLRKFLICLKKEKTI